MKKKDALTDLVEDIQTFEPPKPEEKKPEEKPQGKQEQQVVGNNGEVITLGQERQK